MQELTLVYVGLSLGSHIFSFPLFLFGSLFISSFFCGFFVSFNSIPKQIHFDFPFKLIMHSLLVTLHSRFLRKVSHTNWPCVQMSSKWADPTLSSTLPHVNYLHLTVNLRVYVQSSTKNSFL